MRKWILLLLGLVMVANLTVMGLGCSKKEPEKPAVKEEAKPAEAPAPAAPAEETKPAPAEPEKK
jgi:hypothetical protein